ncbi:MAG: P-II family nitrogen regulator [Fidelibacterota bacterium]
MKEIKAYIKCSKVENVINGLHRIGVENLTVIDVMALGSGMIDPRQIKYSIECVEKYSDVAKLEITCSDRDVDEIVEIIRSRAYSGEKGDGVIFVLNVDRAVKIRTGETGDEFLQPKRVTGQVLPEKDSVT